jgi:predicted dinucleotide-binding enzyme
MNALRIAVLGSGPVARTLASGFLKHGYPVHMGNREPAKLAEFTASTGIQARNLSDAVGQADLVVLALKASAAEEVVRSLASGLAGKTVIDTMNPIADTPPVDGVLTYFTDGSASLMERLQAIAPDARFVKAFNSVGSAFMVDPAFPEGRPTMFIAGDDLAAKSTVSGILEAFGWESEDMGRAASARPIEALCQLWCARGFAHGQWGHAFKLLKV